MRKILVISAFALLFLSACATQQTSTAPVRPSRMPTFESTAERNQGRQSRQQSTTEVIATREANEIRQSRTADTVIAILPTHRQARPRPQQPREQTRPQISVERTLAIPQINQDYQDPNLRIMLHRNIKSHRIRIHGHADISSKNTSVRVSDGELEISFINENTIQISAHGRRQQIALPCTLSFVSGKMRFSDGANEYRGQIIFTSGQNGFSLINYIGLEDYLRGVLPLEIGVRGEPEFEALKAQAIAARTFALSRMLASRNREFDMVATVMDQVYGGSGNEYALSDLAIAKTRGIVVAKQENGALLETFFHAICGGQTAAVNEVWNSQPNPSLVSRSDLDENGVAFCATANWFNWTETWSIAQFSQILHKYSRSTIGEAPFDGTVRAVNIASRTPSGRVNVLEIRSNSGTFTYGRDRSRFVLRRPTRDEGILRSANFEIRIDGGQVRATGRGFGHGIGMCQNGALERARRGQDFTQILSAYYTNIKLAQVNDFLD